MFRVYSVKMVRNYVAVPAEICFSRSFRKVLWNIIIPLSIWKFTVNCLQSSLFKYLDTLIYKVTHHYFTVAKDCRRKYSCVQLLFCSLNHQKSKKLSTWFKNLYSVLHITVDLKNLSGDGELAPTTPTQPPSSPVVRSRAQHDHCRHNRLYDPSSVA